MTDRMQKGDEVADARERPGLAKASPLRVGDKVQYTRAYLLCTDQWRGGAGTRRGVIAGWEGRWARVHWYWDDAPTLVDPASLCRVGDVDESEVNGLTEGYLQYGMAGARRFKGLSPWAWFDGAQDPKPVARPYSQEKLREMRIDSEERHRSHRERGRWAERIEGATEADLAALAGGNPPELLHCPGCGGVLEGPFYDQPYGRETPHGRVTWRACGDSDELQIELSRRCIALLWEKSHD